MSLQRLHPVSGAAWIGERMEVERNARSVRH